MQQGQQQPAVHMVPEDWALPPPVQPMGGRTEHAGVGGGGVAGCRPTVLVHVGAEYLQVGPPTLPSCISLLHGQARALLLAWP